MFGTDVLAIRTRASIKLFTLIHSALSHCIDCGRPSLKRLVINMKINEANKQILKWRYQAKANHKYTDEELAKRIGCSASRLTHKDTLYKLPYLQAMKLKELAEE